MTQKKEVLIVGAGPTGLVLALELAHYKVPFKIIDKKKGTGQSSRAMLVIPKVLESYQKYGLDQTVIDKGIRPEQINYYLKNEKKTEIPIGSLGTGQSVYPFLITYPQDEHEQILVDKLEELGHSVHWETSFDQVEKEEEEVEVVLTSKGETTHEPFSYVIGCDGASSQVRKAAGIDFEGETYEEVFYVLDAVVEGEIIHEKSASFSFVNDYFALFFPLKNKETTRVIGMYPPELIEAETFNFQEIKPRLEETFNITIQEKNWFSEYKIHRRTAERFKKGKIILAGDAAHIHSPVGGQGMNLGIGDSVNLGWKLAAVFHQGVDKKMIDTYETERKSLAEAIVSTTDNVFEVIASQSKLSNVIRTNAVPLIAKMAGSSKAVQRRLFLIISQLYVSYEDSVLSSESDADIKSGKRLPYADGEQFEFTRESGWQLHYFKKEPEDLRKKNDPLVKLIKRRWTDKTRDAGFEKEYLYLVRPDGYIGWIGKSENSKDLEAYLNKWCGQLQE